MHRWVPGAKITAKRACQRAERSISALRRGLLMSTYWNITCAETVRARKSQKEGRSGRGAGPNGTRFEDRP